MVQRKMEQKRIDDVGKRNTAYRKRIQGMKKKASELATLCAIPTLLLSFGPSGQVDTWPESGQEVNDIIRSYSILSSEDKDRNKLSLEEFLESQIKKKKQDMQCNINVEDLQIDGQSEETLREQIRLLDTKMEEIKERMQFLSSNQSCMELSVVTEGEKMLGEHNGPTVSENCSINVGSGFGEGMPLSSAGLADLFKTIGEVYEEESNYNIGFKNSWKNNVVNYQDLVPTDDNQHVRYGSCNELMMAVNPFLPQTDKNSNGNRNVGPFPQFEAANQQTSMTTTSLTSSSPFGDSVGVATDNYLQYPSPSEASICYAEPSIANLEIPDLPDLDYHETFDNHHFMDRNSTVLADPIISYM